MNKLKRYITLITTQMAFAFCVVGYGYTQYTNQLNITPNKGEITFNYNWDRVNLVSVTAIQDSLWDNYGYGAYEFKEYDANFNVINQKRYVDTNYIYGFGRSMVYHQEAYYAGGYKDSAYYQNDTTVGFLIKFDTLGNKIWEKYFHSDVEKVDIKFILPHDSLVILCVGDYNPTSGVNPNAIWTSVIAVDTSGIIIWEKNYLGFNEYPVNFKKTSDGGFIITTFTQVTAANDTRIYKLDNLGNTQWVQTLGNAIDSHWLGAQETPSGEYICYGWKTVLSTKKSWLVKLDNNGNIIMDTIYDFTQIPGYRDYFNPEGNIVFTTSGIFITGWHKDMPSVLTRSYLAFFNYDLELQWFRPFGKRTYNDLITFIKPYPPNPEYLFMCGTSFSDDTSNTNDEWFIVVDSLGCDVLNCSVGVEENEQGGNELKIYPNPARDEITVEIEGSFGYQIVSLSGQIVKKGINFSEKINVSKLSRGYYILKVQQDIENYSTPLIISK